MKFEVGQKYQTGHRVFKCVYVLPDTFYGPFVVLQDMCGSGEDSIPVIAQYEQDLCREAVWESYGPFTWVKVLSCHVHGLKRNQYVLAEKPDE